ncbi:MULTISPECIES: hypothetical protein [Actinoalloteichus]|uniref:hypothetical protein n=1 Tax=Actinoalloteichus TaxID=65496 RepID=UPI001E491792|nr:MULTISPECIES: hypothetical protein [Actinoalloteichus]
MRGVSGGGRGALSTLSGTLTAGIASSLSVSAHALAGGTAPNLGLTLILTALLAAGLIATPGRRRSLPATLLTLTFAQLGMHLLLEALSNHGHPAAAETTGFDPLLMIGAHAAATIIGALLLTHAEQVLRRGLGAFARSVARLRLLLIDGPVVDTPRSSDIAPLTIGQSRHARVLARRANTRRGPPALSARTSPRSRRHGTGPLPPGEKATCRHFALPAGSAEHSRWPGPSASRARARPSPTSPPSPTRRRRAGTPPSRCGCPTSGPTQAR